jgi:hypothetical protein
MKNARTFIAALAFGLLTMTSARAADHDIYANNPDMKPEIREALEQLLNDNFVLVDVNIGRYDMNQDIADKYGMNLKKGVPALAVLSPDGKVLHAQTAGEFEDMRHMDASSVTDFLNEWKPKK